jgi:hypothetical protein
VASTLLITTAASGAVFHADAMHPHDKPTDGYSPNVFPMFDFLKTIDIPPDTPAQDNIVKEITARMADGKGSGQSIVVDLAGGGTSGVVSAAVLCALSDTEWLVKELKNNGSDLSAALAKQAEERTRGDYNPTFDAVDEIKGSSIGGLVGAYWKGENLYNGTKLFFNLGPNFFKQPTIFFNQADFFLGVSSDKPPMNLSYIKDGIDGKFGPNSLNATRVEEGLKKGPPIYIVATDRKTLKTVVINASGMPYDEFEKTVFAACGLPGITTPPRGTKIDLKLNTIREALGQLSANPPPEKIIDAKYSGGTDPLYLNQTKADIKIELNNEPVGRTGTDSLTYNIQNPLILAFSVVNAASLQDFARIWATSMVEGARNDAEVRQALKDPHVLFLGLPPGVDPVSSSELDHTKLKTAADQSYAYAIAIMVRNGINNGDIKARRNAVYELTPPPQWGNASYKAVVKTDMNGRASAQIIEVRANIAPANFALIVRGSNGTLQNSPKISPIVLREIQVQHNFPSPWPT